MRVRIKEILGKREGKYLFVDLIMMAVLAINLSLILFDFTFSSPLIQGLFERYTPGFYKLYNTYIHQDFLIIDVWFVTIFIIELVIRWILAVRNNTYHKWFFYPFIHWYDVLGCIPLGSFRFLRVLRVIGLTVRLQKLGVIDLTQTYVYSKFIKYLNIFTEEVSDRVVIQVLTGVQDEIKNGSPVLNQIIGEVIQPQKAVLVEWLSHRLQQVASEAHRDYIEDLHEYLDAKIASAIENNPELKNISRIPIVGSMVTNNLEKTVSDMINHVVDQSLQDLASPNNKEIVDDFTHLVLDTFLTEKEDMKLDGLVKNILLESLELVKNQVKIQQWKVQEQKEQEEMARQKLEKVVEGQYDEPDSPSVK